MSKTWMACICALALALACAGCSSGKSETETTSQPVAKSAESPSESSDQQAAEIEEAVTTTAEPQEPANQPSSDGGVSPKFKQTMDDFETFFAEYVDFMKQYQTNPQSLELPSEYSDIMARYTNVMESMNEIDTTTLSADDYAYYAQANANIAKMLAEVD